MISTVSPMERLAVTLLRDIRPGIPALTAWTADVEGGSSDYLETRGSEGARLARLIPDGEIGADRYERNIARAAYFLAAGIVFYRKAVTVGNERPGTTGAHRDDLLADSIAIAMRDYVEAMHALGQQFPAED